MQAGCALQPAPDATTQACTQALAALQSAVTNAGVTDAQYQPVNGFPTYRTDRFWSEFANQSLSPQQNHEWRQRLHTLGMQSLAIEWQNLPITAKQQWQTDSGFAHFNQFHQQCSGPLFNATLTRRVSASAVEVPDAYNTWQRVLGLYALTGPLARGSIADYQTDMRNLMGRGVEALQHPTRLYASATTIIGNQPDTAPSYSSLGVPQYDTAALQALLWWHAPRLQIEQHTPADRIGSARWQGNVRTIDPATPQLYSYVSYIRYQQRVLLQLNYVAWFSERPPQEEGDWYAGKLDGLVWRVTLQPDGSVLFYDSIHPCGCFHSVHLPANSSLQIPSSGAEPLMVFNTDLDPRTPNPVLLIQSDVHYLITVLAQPVTTADQQTYVLADYDQLRTLPDGQGYRNWFDADGLIAESSRKERFYLWPLGVPNAGAMRQRGHHAIAFLGRRHFDEPSVEKLLLLDKSD